MPAIDSPRAWLRLAGSVAGIFALFQWLGSALGSDRGQAGVLIGIAIVAATLAAERTLFRAPGVPAAVRLGLGRPRGRGIAAAAAVAAAILLVFPVFGVMTGTTFRIRPDALLLLPGLFAQAGIAEETLFRGYLFGHLRRGRTFGRAAALSMLPFVAVHLWLFVTMAWPIALAAVVVATVLSFPLAYAYELGGNTIWPPAILHAVIQGAIKIVDVSGDASPMFPFAWMAASTLLPMLLFAVPPVRRP